MQYAARAAEPSPAASQASQPTGDNVGDFTTLLDAAAASQPRAQESTDSYAGAV